MDNNIRVLTLAEWMSGAAQHLDSFVCLAVRSGVGAGIVLDGKLFGGSHGFAGEPGYAPVTLGQDARAVEAPAGCSLRERDGCGRGGQ